ncbi:hypothetical protein [Desulfococcus sp.]|uniref:hypothetical protein n=1 Tax=Desulfococcus sp. TaxID=2025834 RepID=UPI0035939696
MRVRTWFILPLLALILAVAGCGRPKVVTLSSPAGTFDPIRMETTDVAVVLRAIARQDDEGALIEDPGWREYIMEIKNLGTDLLTVQNVKLLNQDGRYVDSASGYEQITAPPTVGGELASDVVGTAAGMAATQFVPCGGTLFGLLSNATKASSAGSKAKAKRDFMLRVLKNVELAPAGKVEGSAFLPNIPNPRALVVNYAQGGKTNRVEVPLPSEAPEDPEDPDPS